MEVKFEKPEFKLFDRGKISAKMNKFGIKDEIDKLMYGLHNFISEIFYELDFKSKNILRKNESFKNIHTGERCFILGTGPSLNKLTDREIDILKKEIIFGVNSLYKSRVGSALTPKYYALMDNLYWEQWSNIFSEVSNKYRDDSLVFITDLRAKNLVDQLERKNLSIYLYSKKYPTKKMSADIYKNIYAVTNVVSYSILCAMYMGFREIYLLGCDYNAFCTAGKGHCYDDKSELTDTNYNLAFYLRFYWMTTEFHYLIAKLAKEKEVSVINLTPNSLLDAYPRITTDSVL